MQLLIIFGDSLLSNFICFVACELEPKNPDALTDYFVLLKIKNHMLHSSGQIKACMTSKQCTFENNITFYSDKKTTQHKKKTCTCVFSEEKGSN